MTALPCPQCKQALAPHELEGVAVSRCQSHHGLWVSEQGFRLAKDSSEPNAVWMDVELWRDHDKFEVQSRDLPCPSCQGSMATLIYDKTGVEIDYCVDCKGLWLEDKEFEKIIHALRDELARMPASDLAKASLEEALELVTGPEPRLLEWQDVTRVLELLKLRVLIEHPTLSGMVRGFFSGRPLP